MHNFFGCNTQIGGESTHVEDLFFIEVETVYGGCQLLGGLLLGLLLIHHFILYILLGLISDINW